LTTGITQTLVSQAAEPRGALGWVVAWSYRVLFPQNRPNYGKIAALLDPQPEDDVLDVACGARPGTVGSVQVSGDNVLLKVASAIEPVPHSQPFWVALGVPRLE
jgi:hypothetical protein